MQVGHEPAGISLEHFIASESEMLTQQRMGACLGALILIGAVEHHVERNPGTPVGSSGGIRDSDDRAHRQSTRERGARQTRQPA